MNQTLCRSAALYYTEIAQTSPVDSLAEERKLIRRWQRHHDAHARDALVQSHLRFVVTLARKRSRDPDRLPDLIAAGNLGLLQALDRYDLSRKPPTRFLTYAGWWIQKEIADQDYATASLVHVPTHRQKAQRRRARAFQQAVQEHGPNTDNTRDMDPGLPEGTTVAIDILRDTGDEEPSRTPMTFDVDSSNRVLRLAISRLPLREQTVLNLYFGVKDDPRNLVQIASILGISPERVRQIKKNGVELLRTALERQHVEASHDVY